MSDSDAFTAVTRFGLGARVGEMEHVKSDPRAWLLMQTIPSATIALGKTLGQAGEVIPDFLESLRTKDLQKAQINAAKTRQIYIDETGERCIRHISSTRPFEERLVMFWSNHFTVSVQKKVLGSVVNSYENEAIRPHVHGDFSDMLLAVARHPAMLIYLDNAQSIGPNSVAGLRRERGLNENFAREILELHTLGVTGGYSQQDVLALAKILTGWTLDRKGNKVNLTFRFQPATHEPGRKTLLNQSFNEQGEREGVDALRMLAEHPATAQHIAFKLARHFIADQPPEAAVAALKKTFMTSHGNLQAMSRTLISLDAAWQKPLRKFKSPYEFAVSAFRLTGTQPEPSQALQAMDALNYRPFDAPSPAGFEDVAAAWMSPDALLKRIEWAKRLAMRVPGGTNPSLLLETAFAANISTHTRQSVQRAASGSDAIALLLASPEFQRR